MKSKFSEKMKYKFENFMSKGGTSVFISLVVLFIVAFLFAMLVRGVILAIKPEFFTEEVATWGAQVWQIFLEITDPGGVANTTGSSGWIKAASILTIFLGMIIFSVLIAFINSRTEDLLYGLRKGKSKVIENDHTLILGWNERVVDILEELIIANESEPKACVVILAKEDKEEMDDMLMKAIPNTKTTRIVTRNGTAASMNDLNRVNAVAARSAIILADCADGAPLEEQEVSDTRVIKTILALIGVQDGENNINIVGEIYTDRKRQLIDTFEDENINTLNSHEILAKILVQTSRSRGKSSGLAIVYNEILSFDGCEIYFYDANWGGVAFNQLYRHFKDGIPIGIHRAEGELIIHPDNDVVMNEGDEVIIIAEDDSTINFNKTPISAPADLPFPDVKNTPHIEKQLILGWSSLAPIVLKEYADYLMDGSVINIMIKDPSAECKQEMVEAKKHCPNLKINLIDKSPLLADNLSAVDPFSYNNVIILSQKEGTSSSEEVDSDTLVILLLLRKIFDNSDVKEKPTQIITQVLNSENQDLIARESVDDFIVSNKMLTMILAQLSEQPKMKKVYEELFKEEGSEIYLKPANFYFENLPIDISFAGIINAVQKRNEICMGIRIDEIMNDSKQNFGIKVNPNKKKIYHIDKRDTIVVLAEDEF
jgi:hypothetical protein